MKEASCRARWLELWDFVIITEANKTYKSGNSLNCPILF